MLATVTTIAIDCHQVPCIYTDHPHHNGVPILWWIVGAVALLTVLLWLRRRADEDTL